MKIALASEKNVQILTLSGPIGEHDVKVLRAGLQKILGAGKNRVVLELPTAQDLPSAVIREIAAFDLLARELSGRIVLAGVHPSLKAKLEVFAKPPVIVCFETREKAIATLSMPPPPELPVSVPASPAHRADGHDEEIKALRQRIAELTGDCQRLREQVVLATIARRGPADELGYRQRIEFLEAKVESLLAEQQPVAPKLS